MVTPNTAVPSDAYIAVLKAKRGELTAMSTTPPQQFVPLLEVVEPIKNSAIIKAWPHSDDVVWIQPINLAVAEDDDWANTVGQLFDDLRGKPAAVPVVTLDETPETHEAIRDVISIDSRGLVLRLDCEQALDEDATTLSALIDHVLSDCGVSPNQVDLVLDSSLIQGAAALRSNAAQTVLGLIPHLDTWRSRVVVFAAFPNAVGDVVSKTTVGSVPRVDAAAFRHVRSHWTEAALVYGDYAVGVPTYPTSQAFSPIPNIRYTDTSEWRIHRATSKLDPSSQYVALARDVVAASYYRGRSFSPGDAYIDDVANGADGPGNAESYLRAAMSHHFHVVLASLSTHGEP